ncbi:putative aldouronate transport system permease protein [Actinopolymorpha cephalotaxi]|uniref:Aldouronate transport system permease protein n=1 Tax=Actinopolymorpha cephalotaxi TaxID=504797 RepID=A0A1I2K3S8_9ACTN|nr:ABC transporter permease subunit [Actinopolymorpha cephalotaxi]NYH85953.1 putative aldouronate transport system permease protein [Actinopolymorpha cephalotaxi]SFF61845.1 putative aldouronate transport system permease protein [Actinopolymorpha cephalotaxi]
MYVLIAPGLLFFVVFRYLPLLGNIAAWQDYSPFLGFRRSPWVGWANFAQIFSDPELLNALRNTLLLSGLQIVFAFPAPLALALLLNSVISVRVRRWIQTVVYLPHFIGWVIVVSIWNQMLGPTGVLNHVLKLFGLKAADIIGNPDSFAVLVTAQVIWKEVGWGTIIFLAAMLAIPQELYESAALDRAGPWRRIWHVTLPGIASVIILLLILRLGSVLSVGFEQILLQQPAVGADAAQTLDTFVYFRGINGGDWGLATAAGLVKGLVGTVLVLGANRAAKKLGGEGVF